MDALTRGYRLGRAAGYEAGYTDGFASGADTGAARILLALGPAVDVLLPDLTPHTGAYRRYRERLSERDGQPCPRRCDACSACIRAYAVASNLTRYGRPDYPGAARARVAA